MKTKINKRTNGNEKKARQSSPKEVLPKKWW